MSKQNIYDNETFFEGYRKIRDNKANANNIFEIPALFSMLPDLHDKRVLDLGCGFGEHCMQFVEGGAKKVVGIDISAKMLAVAAEENSNPKITYINMPMEDISEIDGTFDVVISSLALHYVENFEMIVKEVYSKLGENGEFIFSQEHPLNTCFSTGERWTRDEKGRKIHANLSNYCVEGVHESQWFVDGVKKYHRTFSTIINTLINAGFTIEKVIEPTPTEEILKEHPEYCDLCHKPDFMLVKARKF